MQVSPQAATVLKRLVKEGFLAAGLFVSTENSIDARERLLLKLLVEKGFAAEVSDGRWEPTNTGRDVDVSNAAPDAYEVVSSFARQGYQTKFIAYRNGVRGIFRVAEHDNFGRGWMVRNVETDEIINSSDLQNISPYTS